MLFLFVKKAGKITLHNFCCSDLFFIPIMLNLYIRHYSQLSLSPLWLSRITAYLEEKIWSFFKCRNLRSGNKILWIRGEIAPKEQFLPFSTIFSVYIFNLRSQITYLFVKFGCSICISLSSANLICRSTDISKCFRGSLRLRDNES